MSLTLKQATTIVEAALGRGRETNCAPLAVAVLGAVGISGDVSDKDEACALAGIAAATLVGDPGA
jgi:uncharacterized protein GlcG (DUF336 family)